MNCQVNLPSISIESEEQQELVNQEFPSLSVMIEKRNLFILIGIIHYYNSKKLKTMIKQSKDKIYKKDVENNSIEKYKGKVEQLEDEIKQVYKMEYFEKEMMQAEQAAVRAQNMLKHHDEIYNRPQK
jgi:hypothetical protein